MQPMTMTKKKKCYVYIHTYQLVAIIHFEKLKRQQLPKFHFLDLTKIKELVNSNLELQHNYGGFIKTIIQIKS
jgi:hypothetical protein